MVGGWHGPFYPDLCPESMHGLTILASGAAQAAFLALYSASVVRESAALPCRSGNLLSSTEPLLHCHRPGYAGTYVRSPFVGRVGQQQPTALTPHLVCPEHIMHEILDSHVMAAGSGKQLPGKRLSG